MKDKLVRYCTNWPESLLERIRVASKETGFPIIVIMKQGVDKRLKELGF